MQSTSTLLNVCIIDDEEGIRKNLKNQFALLDVPINVIGEAASVEQGIRLLQEKKPDVAFLDVEMPDGQGFDILRHLGNLHTRIIFITAHNQYAVEAFRFSAVDYLLKPVDIEELGQAIQKAVNLKEQASYALRMGVFLGNTDPALKQSKRLVLKDSDSIFAFSIPEIIRLQASNNYTTFYVENHSPVIISKTLKDYEDLLVSHGFFRIHQSHLINVRFFSRYDKKDSVVELRDKTILPISARKKDAFFLFLDSM